MIHDMTNDQQEPTDRRHEGNHKAGHSSGTNLSWLLDNFTFRTGTLGATNHFATSRRTTSVLQAKGSAV